MLVVLMAPHRKVNLLFGQNGKDLPLPKEWTERGNVFWRVIHIWCNIPMCRRVFKMRVLAVVRLLEAA